MILSIPFGALIGFLFAKQYHIVFFSYPLELPLSIFLLRNPEIELFASTFA